MNFSEKILNSKIIKDPWPHKIINDTFDIEIFNKLSSVPKFLLDFENIKKNTFLKEKIQESKGEEGTTFGLWDLEQCGIDTETLNLISKVTDDFLKLSTSIFAQFPDHRKTNVELRTKPVFILDKPGNKYPIHDDIFNKIITFVTYMHPTENFGTSLHKENSDESLIKTVEWKQNRSLLFCPQTDITWHSYIAKKDVDSRCSFTIFVGFPVDPT